MSAPPQNNLASAYRPAREAVLIWAALTACLVLGVWMGGQYGERRLSEAIRADAVDAARAAMLGLDPLLHERVARREQMWSDPHKHALASLVAFHRQYPEVSRVRTFMMSGDRVMVILDTETVAGEVGMKRPVNPAALRTPLDAQDPAYPLVRQVLQTREAAAAEHSNEDGYRDWRPGVAPLGTNAAIAADFSSVTQEKNLASFKMWVGTGLGLAVIASGIVALIYFNIRSAHLTSLTTGGEALRSQRWLEQRNRRLVEALGQIVLNRDLDKGTLLWDGDTRGLLGTPVDRMPLHLEEWLPRVHPDDLARVRSFAAGTDPEHRTYELEYRIRHVEGSWRWFRERGVVSYVQDEEATNAATADGVLQDITTLKEEENEIAALALIASRTDNAVCLVDPQGLVQWANLAFQQITQREPAQLRGRELTSLFPNAAGFAALRTMLGEALQGRGGRSELQLVRGNGLPYWANLEFQPLRDDAGVINRIVVIQSDITESKEAEARLTLAKEAAETADRAKSEFLAVMSHEIRTPLNAVLGFTRLLLDTPLNAQQRDYIDTIRSSGDSLLHLLNDILDFSKLDSSGMQLERTPFDLRGCIEDTLDVLIAPATTRGLDLYGDISPDLPAMLIGDRGRLRQILLNLAGNAVKFTEEGEVAVSVRSLASNAGRGPRLRFEVRDTGPGIPPDQQGLLFRPFTQADSSATRKHGGTGLGLAISKRLVDLMGGTIGLESPPGEGATFWFEIPLVAAPNQPAPAAALARLEGLRVLLVERNAGQRRALARQLAAWGMTVESFGRGREAIFAAEHRKFDVALIDANPPDITGLGLVDRLRHTPRRNVGGIVIAGAPGRLPTSPPAAFDALHRLVKPIHATALAETLLRAAPRITRTPLPRPTAAGVVAAGQPPPLHDLASVSGSIAEAGPRILVADDNAINRKLVKKILDGMGLAATLVENGRKAVEAVQAGEFDAILMDIQMPEMDGLAASRAIRGLGRELPIIALTADAMPDDRERCLAAGMNDYLQKPLRPEALRAALDRAMAGAA